MAGYTTFQLPAWVEGRGPGTKYNLAGSASPALSIQGLIDVSAEPDVTAKALDFTSLPLSYNAARHGGEKVRANIAALFSPSGSSSSFSLDPATNILTTTGTSLANQLVLQSLLRPGDHVVCVRPAYAQLYAVATAIGADVSFYCLRPENNWQLDLAEFESLLRPNTKMIVINNPHNPTGTHLESTQLQRVVELAKQRGSIVFCDEIFRPLFQPSNDRATTNGDGHAPGHSHANVNGNTNIPPSMIEFDYDNVVVTGSMSKSYSFPGIRVGWVVSRNTGIIEACDNLRFYTLNSVSPIDEMIAAEALSSRCLPRIIARNLAIVARGRDLWEKYILQSQIPQPLPAKTASAATAGGKGVTSKYQIQWIKPTAVSVTLIQIVHRATGQPVDDLDFCMRAHAEENLLLVPASLCFGDEPAPTVGSSGSPGVVNGAGHGDQTGLTNILKGWMRVQMALDETTLTANLDALFRFLERY